MDVDVAADHTRVRQIRVAAGMWEAFGRVCARRGTTRSGAIVEFMRREILEHGDRRDRRMLELADRELAARRTRKGGRPRSGASGLEE